MLFILLCELYLYIVGVCYLNESHSDIYAACYSLLEGHYCVYSSGFIVFCFIDLWGIYPAFLFKRKFLVEEIMSLQFQMRLHYGLSWVDGDLPYKLILLSDVN